MKYICPFILCDFDDKCDSYLHINYIDIEIYIVYEREVKEMKRYSKPKLIKFSDEEIQKMLYAGASCTCVGPGSTWNGSGCPSDPCSGPVAS